MEGEEEGGAEEDDGGWVEAEVEGNEELGSIQRGGREGKGEGRCDGKEEEGGVGETEAEEGELVV